MEKRLRKKRRIISSVSGVITNSSTQIFELDITPELLRLISDSGIQDDVTIIRTRSDVFDILSDPEKENEKYDIYWLIGSILNDSCLIDDCGYPGYLWEALIESGKTEKEIIEFFDSVISIDTRIVGKVIYSYSDDCGYPKAARILHENNYNSNRES